MAELNDDRLTFEQKVIQMQSELKAPKNLWNDYGKYKYRSAESILEALKPLQLEFGVITTLTDEVIQIGNRFYIKSVATIKDCRTGAFISAVGYAREDETKKGMDGAQITGSCSSYARKYALSSLLLLDDSDDVDSSEYQNQDKQKKTAAKPKAEAKPTPAPAAEPVEPADPNEPNYRAELRDFLAERKIDPKSVVSACNLKPNSSNSEWKAALEYVKAHLDQFTGGEANG